MSWPISLDLSGITNGAEIDADDHVTALTALKDGANDLNTRLAAIEALQPWSVDIIPFLTPATQTNWDTIAVGSGYAIGAIQSDGTQNDEIGWDVVVAAGTYRFSMVHSKGPSRGIYTVSFDGTTADTIDGYTGSVTDNQVSDLTGIALTAGKHRLLLKMADKNASSTGYYGFVQALGLRRTGA